MKRQEIVAAAVAFVTALLLRLSNAPAAFTDGIAVVFPADELYHLKRMAHFVELDPDRGVSGAFCPWPPLYDRAAGVIAHAMGAATKADVLARVVWFPPVAFALFVALAFVWMDRRFGRVVALAAGAALAASPFNLTLSWIGSIDHHWTEPIFVFAILACVCDRRPWLLAIALTAAMFVQTALLIAAALAFVILFFTSDGRDGAIAFGVSAAAIALYRVTRPPGYPDNAWFLGWTHAALFGAACVACGYLWWWRSRFFALLAGASILLATPTAPAALLGGTRFFGGEQWLQTIAEFQPLWKARGEDLLSILVGLGAGALLAWPLARRAWRERDVCRGSFAAAAILYLLLTVTSRRFWSVGIPLLAIAGALEAAALRRRVLRTVCLAAVAIVPVVQFLLWAQHPLPAMPANFLPWLSAARFLQTQPPGRLLAPWSPGHLLDVVGERAVVIDNFGTMPDEITFARAHDAFLTTHEESLARYCDANGIRFIAYEPPGGLRAAATLVGVDPSAYDRTKLAAATVWSRAYEDMPLRYFRRVYAAKGIVIVERR